MQPQKRRTAREKSLRQNGQKISKATKEGFVGGAATLSAECWKYWTTALILRSSGQGTHPPEERSLATQAAWGGGRYKKASSGFREQGRSKTRIDCFAPTRQTGCPRTHG